MNQFKTKTSKRLFYNKYLFKVTIKVGRFAGIFRHDIEALKEQNLKSWSHHYYKDAIAENESLISEVIDFIDQHKNSDLLKRIEGHHIDFYTNSKELFDDITYKFFNIIKHRFEPSPEINAEDPFVINVNKLPHNKYEFKVYLKPHKFNSDRTEKLKYLLWLDSQEDKIKISNSVKTWFMNTDWNWDRRYIFVQDEPTFLMMTMRYPAAIGRVYRHRVIDK